MKWSWWVHRLIVTSTPPAVAARAGSGRDLHNLADEVAAAARGGRTATRGPQGSGGFPNGGLPNGGVGDLGGRRKWGDASQLSLAEILDRLDWLSSNIAAVRSRDDATLVVCDHVGCSNKANWGVKVDGCLRARTCVYHRHDPRRR